MEDVFYYTLSIGVAILSIFSVYIAKRSMERGLTYSATVSLMWTLGFIAAARLVHTAREVFALKQHFGEIPEILEYVLYIVAYIVFIWLHLKVRKLGEK